MLRYLLALVFVLVGCSNSKQNTESQTRPIKVGVLVSYFHGSGPHWIARPYSYDTTEMIEALDRPDILLVPVIEPGTETKELIQPLFSNPAFTQKAIDGSDPDQLKNLDILVIPRTANMVSEVTTAIVKAQEEGLKLMISAWCGTVTPTYASPDINLLHGITQGAYFWHPQPQTAVVKAKHPLLEGLAVGDSIQVKPNGVGGNLGTAEILIEMGPDFSRNFGPGPTAGAEPYTQPIIYISNAGKGRVIQFNWFKKPDCFSDEFFANAARWLVGRDMHAPSKERPE